MSDGPGDLVCVARQLKQMASDVGSMRDDLTVLTAITMGQDGTLSALLTEMRAMYLRDSRIGNRVRVLEATVGGMHQS